MDVFRDSNEGTLQSNVWLEKASLRHGGAANTQTDIHPSRKRPGEGNAKKVEQGRVDSSTIITHAHGSGTARRT